MELSRGAKWLNYNQSRKPADVQLPGVGSPVPQLTSVSSAVSLYHLCLSTQHFSLNMAPASPSNPVSNPTALGVLFIWVLAF